MVFRQKRISTVQGFMEVGDVDTGPLTPFLSCSVQCTVHPPPVLLNMFSVQPSNWRRMKAGHLYLDKVQAAVGSGRGY